MGYRRMAREARLYAAILGLEQTRSRSKGIASTLIERQRGDWRRKRFDSSQPAAILASIRAISRGEGVEAAAAASIGSSSDEGGFGGSGGDGYYGGGGFVP